uniref:Uncharacterized protein n=1 Tax=Heterorhabditis bacteriophora TaxID=37862 RepID=A0A1I7WTQ6_HETBA
MSFYILLCILNFIFSTILSLSVFHFYILIIFHQYIPIT